LMLLDKGKYKASESSSAVVDVPIKKAIEAV
jgi:hypothetical protein